jgi:purine nucleosidase
MMALKNPDIRVEAITTVAGNVSVAQATRNSLYVTELCGQRVPVFQGIGGPLLQPRSRVSVAHAEGVFGKDGLGDLGLDPPEQTEQAEHAVDAMISRFTSEPGQISLVTLGPLSNVALALSKEPQLAKAVSRIYMMGGTANALGNVTPSAEFNVWADPEAAQVLLSSGADITMIGWELVWGDMLINQAEMKRLRESSGPCGRFAVDCCRKVVPVVEQLIGQPSLSLPDGIAMAVAIDPSVCRTEALHVSVETRGQYTRGETIVDRFGVLGCEPNVDVCFDPDSRLFKHLLFSALT